VEHPPIEKSAPATRTLSISRAPRVDDLHRSTAASSQETLCGRRPFLLACRAQILDANPAALRACLAIDHKPVGTLTIRLSRRRVRNDGRGRSSRSTRARWSYRSHSGPPADEGELRVELKLRGMQASEIRH